MRTCLLLCLLAGVLLGAVAAVPVKEQLPNGLRLVTLSSTASQVVSFSLLVDFAALDEPTEYMGLRQVMLTAMMQGSTVKDGVQIRRALAACGGVMEARMHQDALEYTVRVPAGAEKAAISALYELVCRPRLLDDDVTAALAQSQARLEIPPVGALEYTNLLTMRALYGDHPYAARTLGTADGLDSLTPSIVRWAYGAYVVPRNAVLAVVGRNTERLLPALRDTFGAWASKPKPPRAGWSAPGLDRSVVVLREKPVRSTCVMLTFPVCGVGDRDFLTLRVIEALLSGGTGARLFRTVREKLHLAYETSTELPVQVSCSHFSIYALTSSQYMDQAKTAICNELIRLQTEPVPATELQRAKAYLKSRYAIDHQYSAQYAFDLAWYELLGVGTRFDNVYAASVDAITAADVQRVARESFTHYLCMVVVPLAIQPPASTP
jgi:zinc protease